ncbi:MAG: N-acetyl-gamma-glutamyl-phosphate reductase [Chitinophagaceae bacterium]|nr:N-acetyl-gamma-glutamyl-phosphate reductase [Chitinophagaceae bacterium]
MKIRVGIIGGAGYTGGELIRVLLNHPQAEIVFVNSKSNAGKYIHEVHSDLLGDSLLKFSLPGEITPGSISVLFLCVGHGEAGKFLEQNKIDKNIKIIDLSQDFRLAKNAETGDRKFIYGLPELNKEKIREANNITNPGCFATAIQLGLLPLAKNKLLKDVYTTGITGSTGAGQGLSDTSHFSWRANNIQAYKTLTHQHLFEINEALDLSPSVSSSIHFVPWRGDFTRGIFISSQLKCDLTESDIKKMYEDFYKEHPFTFFSHEPISLKQVVNTNKCVVQIEKIDDNLVVHSAIDNLLKGASGQAVQNMNLMFGIDEEAGLKLKANYF